VGISTVLIGLLRLKFFFIWAVIYRFSLHLPVILLFSVACLSLTAQKICCVAASSSYYPCTFFYASSPIILRNLTYYYLLLHALWFVSTDDSNFQALDRVPLRSH
jgi:hypothetical protein